MRKFQSINFTGASQAVIAEGFRRFPGFVAPANPTQADVFTLTTVPTTPNGTIVSVYCWVVAVDSTVTADVSSTISEGAMRVTSNILAAIATNRLDKQTGGGAGTFSALVSFAVVPIGQDIRLRAASSGAAATGNLQVVYQVVRSSF